MKEENIFDDFEVVDLTEDIGDAVCCDFCNFGEDTMGGVMIGSNAICGDCCKKNDYYYDKAEDVDYYFDRNRTFKENVLKYRKDNARNKINSSIKFRVGEGHTFKDNIKSLTDMQLDVEEILKVSMEMEKSNPSKYRDAVKDYIKRRPSIFEVLKNSYEDLHIDSIEEFDFKLALMHLHVKQHQIESNKNDKSIKIEAPQTTGYVVCDTVEEQEQALQKVRESEEMKDIFPDIARA